MIVSIFAAMSENRVVGIENRLPWNLPDELKRFKSMTTGHPIIMGRKTFESIGRILPNRENIIISRQNSYSVPGTSVYSSVDEALEKCRGKTDEVFLIGGAEIWRAAWSWVDQIYLTIVHKNFEGDAYFPDFDRSEFQTISIERFENTMPYTCLKLKKKRLD